MEGWGRDLVVGVVGSLIGAVLISLFSFGFQLTKLSREKRRKLRGQEIEDWRSADLAKRQRIFNSYLFAVLKFFIIGSILIGVANAIGDLNVADKTSPLGTLDYMAELFDATGVLFYLATFSQILQFTPLLKRHS